MKENSLGISFFGLTKKEYLIFQRVIQFFEKKGKYFHEYQQDTVDSTTNPKISTTSAAIFIVKNTPDAVEQAKLAHTQQAILTITDANEKAVIGEYSVQQPLLVTRVMRAIDGISKHCQTQTPTTANINTTAPTKPTPTPTTKKSVEKLFRALVVDDNATIRKQLELELRETNIAADYADCGTVALDKIDSKQYDLVFLDIVMPDIDGYEVCKQLRKKPSYKRTPVIMLSGKTEPLDEVAGILAGASTYLLKPVKHADFQKTLGRISKWLKDFA